MLSTSRALRPARRADGVLRVLHETLRACERARHVEAPVEAAEILGRLERFLERGFGETQGGREAFELARVDVGSFHARMLPSRG